MLRVQNVEQLAQELVGQSVYVCWPHMMEARVISVASDEFR